MRLYLDTNILIFFILNRDEIQCDILAMISDYENILLTSSVCVEEFIHLCQIGKLEANGKNRTKPEEIIAKIEEAGIEIVLANKKHLATLASMPMHGEHRDPNDRLIIAQAISDRVPLISSDHKFRLYVKDGLQWIFNER